MGMACLDTWPVIPCVSRGRTVLVQPVLLPHLFVMIPSCREDLVRDQLREALNAEDKRTSLGIEKEIEEYSSLPAADNMPMRLVEDEEWAWTQQPSYLLVNHF